MTDLSTVPCHCSGIMLEVVRIHEPQMVAERTGWWCPKCNEWREAKNRERWGVRPIWETLAAIGESAPAGTWEKPVV